MATITKRALDLIRGSRRPKLPYWHGTCSLDHRSAEDAARCRRTD